VQCWGSNIYGQLGDGLPAPWRVANHVSGLSSGVAAIGAGSAHTCAILSASGGVKCWGANSVGQLGNGMTGAAETLPVDVVGLGGPAKALALGTSYSCALLLDKTVRCWGHLQGQAPQPTPVAVPGLAGVAALSTGGSQACAVLESGAVKCWGQSATGLGDGATFSSPVPVDVAGLPSGAVAISVAGAPQSLMSGSVAHSFALTTAGGLKGWGSNTRGQLGDGTQTSRATPVDVTGLTSGVARISAGQGFSVSFFGWSIPMGHACAVTNAGAVKCWGSNRCSQLGTPGGACGPSDDQFATTPQDVSGLGGGVSDVAAGAYFTCALMSTDGAVKCWGVSSTAWPGSPAPAAVPAGTMPQSITFGPDPTVDVGSSGNLAMFPGSSRNPVTLASLTPAICSVPASVDSPPPLLVDEPVEVTVTGHAEGVCRFTANQAGNAYYDAAVEVTAEVLVARLAQTITFNSAPAALAVEDMGTIEAVASSGLAVTYTSLTPFACSVSGNVVTGVRVGPCTIEAFQGGNETFGPAQATRTFPVTFGSDAPPRVSNISTRMHVLAGDDRMIAGFVIGGGSSKTVAIVATGPSLVVFGVGNGLADPVLTVVRSSDGAVVAANDDWNLGPDAEQLASLGFAPPFAPEAAILVNLPPGAYTAIVEGRFGGTGVSVIGVYELDEPTIPLTNISTRGRVGTGNDVMIGGFVIQGSGPQTVAIVATGPSLAGHGIDNPLANPTLRLVRSLDQSTLAVNDDWQADANASQLQAAGFAPVDPLESALYVTLPPGAYTAIVSGVGEGTGVSVVGIYRVP
jgi:alpha-tubulin suppressor-like RCC1 family protein